MCVLAVARAPSAVSGRRPPARCVVCWVFLVSCHARTLSRCACARVVCVSLPRRYLRLHVLNLLSDTHHYALARTVALRGGRLAEYWAGVSQ